MIINLITINQWMKIKLAFLKANKWPHDFKISKKNALKQLSFYKNKKNKIFKIEVFFNIYILYLIQNSFIFIKK